jgi:hypothetical protein
MTLYMMDGDTRVPWKGEPIEGISHPRDIERKWSESELLAIGLHKPEPAPEVSEVETPVITSELVNAHRDAVLAQGAYFVPDIDLSPVRVTCRLEDTDTLLGLVLTARIRISEGDTTLTTYRDGDNAYYQLSPLQIVTLWKQVSAWIEKVHKASWDIKDLDPIPEDYQERFEALVGE